MTDLLWLNDINMTPGESLLFLLLLIFLAAMLQGAMVWDWVREKLGLRKKER